MLVSVSEFSTDPANLLPLGGPVHDVRVVRAALTAPETGLFDENNVHTVSDPKRDQLQNAVFEFFSAGKRDDLLLFYYSGHGRLTPEGKLFLCAGDTVASRLPVSGISAAFLRECMDVSAAQTFVIVLDCCHSGAFRGEKVDSLNGQGTFILSSSRARQLANDGDGTGPSPFTAAFVKAMTTPETDSDRDGRITFDDVYNSTYTYLKQFKQYPQRSPGEGNVTLARARHEASDTRPTYPESAIFPPEARRGGQSGSVVAVLEPVRSIEVAKLPTPATAEPIAWKAPAPSLSRFGDSPQKEKDATPVESGPRWHSILLIAILLAVLTGVGVLAAHHFPVVKGVTAGPDAGADVVNKSVDAEDHASIVGPTAATAGDVSPAHPKQHNEGPAKHDDNTPMETCVDPSSGSGKNPVKIDSAPQGAAIFMNATSCARIGVTPWQGKLRTGDYTVIIQAPGYNSETRPMSIANSQRERELFFPLNKIPKIDVRADADPNVAGAIIWLDGAQVGAAPKVVTATVGQHQVELRKDGFESWNEWVPVSDNLDLTLTPSLKAKPKFGSIVVEANVRDGEIWLDGTNQNKSTPDEIQNVPEGIHVVEVRKPPAAPAKYTVDVKANQHNKVHAELRQ